MTHNKNKKCQLEKKIDFFFNNKQESPKKAVQTHLGKKAKYFNILNTSKDNTIMLFTEAFGQSIANTHNVE